MKAINLTIAGMAMALLCGPALGESMSLIHFKPHVMPVLVAVNAKGKVTRVLPSTELSPKFQRLLTEDLGHWIAAPAKVKGRAVDSQLIINVALRATKLKDGNYSVSFAYVSSLPSPGGAAPHWFWRDGDQLTLVQ